MLEAIEGMQALAGCSGFGKEGLAHWRGGDSQAWAGVGDTLAGRTHSGFGGSGWWSGGLAGRVAHFSNHRHIYNMNKV